MSSSPNRNRRLRVELLEQRRLLALTVDTLSDVVDPEDGMMSLREAIAAAAVGETIDFAAALFTSGGAKSINLAPMLGSLFVSRSLTILGPGAELLTIDASTADATPLANNGDGARVFQIDADSSTRINVVLSGLTLTGGDPLADGGAISSFENLEVVDSVISGNASVGFYGGRGGGIFSGAGSLTLRRTTVADNVARLSGGGIASDVSYNYATAAIGLAINDATISANVVTDPDGVGGGIFSAGVDLVVSNSTLSNNAAPAGGGGIYSDYRVSNLQETIGSTVAAFSTITGNGTQGSGGGISVPGDLQIRGSIVAGNSATVAADLRSRDDGFVPAVTYSLIGDNDGSGLSEAPLAAPDADGNLIGSQQGSGVINARMAPLADNGGPTQTHAFLPGSPAIDAGPPSPSAEPFPPFDQRGQPFLRVADGNFDGIGRIDMGSFELTRQLVVDTILDISNGDLSVGDVSLREAIMIATNVPALNLITFSRELGGQPLVLQCSLPALVVPMTIDGSSLDEGVTIDANATGRIFTIESADPLIDVALVNLTLTGGEVVGDGGGILSSENLTLTNVTVAANRALRGGGIFSRAGRLTIAGGEIRGNIATANARSGGGVYVQAGDVAIADTTIQENHAPNGDGGGVLNFDGNLNITTSTISGNTAQDSGGGVYNVQGAALIRSSTISGNTADDSGGGIYNWDASQANLRLEFCTISDNYARSGQGGGVAANASLSQSPNPNALETDPGVVLVGSLVAGNRGGGDVATIGLYRNATLYYRSRGYNLLGSGNAIAAFGAADLTGVLDPGLQPLGDYGGPTRTHALRPDSPAIDPAFPGPPAGLVPPPYDQRGAPYVTGVDGDDDGGQQVDIGAYEYQSSAVPVVVNGNNVSVLGDLDANGSVDAADLVRWRESFGTVDGPLATPGDADGDRDVDGNDFLIWQRTVGHSVPPAAASVMRAPAVDTRDASPEEIAVPPLRLGADVFPTSSASDSGSRGPRHLADRQHARQIRASGSPANSPFRPALRDAVIAALRSDVATPGGTPDNDTCRQVRDAVFADGASLDEVLIALWRAVRIPVLSFSAS